MESVTPDGEARGEEKSVKPVDEAREEEEKSVEEAVHDDYFQYFHDGFGFPLPPAYYDFHDFDGFHDFHEEKEEPFYFDTEGETFWLEDTDDDFHDDFWRW